MATRRAFIAGLIATGLSPKPTWADAGSPAFLSAAKKPDGRYVLCGLRADGQIAFELVLPARGHAATAHPIRPEAVAFARRPGTYALVLECADGRQKARLEAPKGRLFYGHGAFSADGELLFTTENDFENARGVVGVWDAQHGYARLGEFGSGGVGPHDIKLMPGGETLVVANGGIETHPETGRTKLNLSSMRSNLSYVTLEGVIDAQMELAASHQRNSIRHLAVAESGDVAFAMQWQGDLTDDLPLLGVHNKRNPTPRLFSDASGRTMQGYLGSIAVNNSGNHIAVTSPRSGTFQIHSIGGPSETSNLTDVCGVAAFGEGFVVTSGTGAFRTPTSGDTTHNLAWDNHLIAI